MKFNFKNIKFPSFRFISVKGNKHSTIIISDKKVITKVELIEALTNLNIRQIKAQVNSGKYLRNTFIETGNQKDFLRYFSSPIFYSEKLFDVIKVLDFRYLNDFLAKKNLELFNLDIEPFLLRQKKLSVNNAKEFFDDLHAHLDSKKRIICSHPELNNIRVTFEIKIRDLVDDLDFFKSNVVLITEMAGQGKTNFLCDYTENFLLKKKILSVFLTGIEICADDIRKSIIKRIFPDYDDIDFSEILDVAKQISKENGEYFVIIIDGINENYKSKVFAKNLEIFISDMQQYDFVKIIISCRSEYYKDNFTNLEKSTFSNDMIVIDSLMKRNIDRNIKKKLFKIYIENFKIKYKSINREVKDQLLSNFLLLRIFCETYQGKELDTIDNIYKEELFTYYYDRKSEQINLMLNDINAGQISGSIDIKKFIKKVIAKMIEKKQYVNIVLDEIIDTPSEKEIYVRFLDENILIKRDLIESENNVFSPTEVVNFTFDEFRDFLISDFLISELYVKAKDKFLEFLKDLHKDSPLIEGCSTFLFYKSKRSTDEALKLVINNQEWYKNVFSRCVFNIKDELISDDDKKIFKEILFDADFKKKKIFVDLINRRDNQVFSIDFLFDSIREMNEEEYRENFVNVFGESSFSYLKINQEEIVKILDEKLNNTIVETDSQHKLFELLLYMFLNNYSYDIKELYERYCFRYLSHGKDQIKRALTSKNESLKLEITKFLKRYEISV
ncbi:hypothetical protein [Flavobacterium okayamense]|uniref:NACHT domain-containing protein n=1 Tax=Flavobacterium okayamense TaxID=2830782 RepID=A0ABM7S7A7_9FLAO|nr:hypothetical protein [Flavobacterium okayamense]BCY29355.1 hypothetical protein KK2020170_22230 [Flavobacterium okayamense]